MHDPTRIRRGPIVAVLLLGAMLMGLALASVSARAAEPSKCGAQATGIDKAIRTTAEPSGRVVTAAVPGRWVDRSGIWRDCQPWVPPVGGDPEMPQPAPDVACAARQTYEAWEEGERVCTSVPPGVTMGMQLMLPKRRPGQQALIASDKSWTAMGRSTYGWQLYRCVALANGLAEWRAEGGICRWATE